MKSRDLHIGMMILLAIFCSGCNQKSKQEQTDIDAINELYSHYRHFVETDDLDGFMTCWDDHGTRAEPGIPPLVGKEAIRVYFRGRFDAAHLKITPYGEFKIEIFGDCAYGFSTATLTSITKDGNDTMQIDLKVLSIIKKQDDSSWKFYIDCVNFQPTLIMDTIPEALKKDNPYY